jgi:hypothetical protein
VAGVSVGTWLPTPKRADLSSCSPHLRGPQDAFVELRYELHSHGGKNALHRKASDTRLTCDWRT